MTTSSRLRALQELRDFGGERLTDGLPDAVIARFLDLDPELGRAVDEALAAHEAWRASFGEQLAWPEDRLRAWLQEDLVNFYPADAVNPYVPLAARGPWLVTTHGAVLHDNGGYGMLGFGHAPDAVLAALGRPVVAANVMTPSLSHRRFTDALRREIGHTRGGCPFARFLCMNSGSEAVTVAMRIADARARRFTDPGGRHAGRKVRFLALEGGFHGRTDRPAQASDSSREAYRKLLRTFRDDDALWTVPANDVPALRAAFERADREGVFFEMLLVEPVMGEGRPGLAMTRAFYDEARRLSAEHGALLLVDSIQAGLRAHGVLSLVDYPGFHDAAPPDLETWSKALNAAQYPLSVLGLTSDAAAAYVSGLYGNTMTSHPRGLEVGLATLSLLTDDVRRNIVDRGHDLLERFRALQRELPDLIVGVDGTGLLLAVDIAPGKAHVTGPGGLEERLRRRGLGVIHGGRNALRFTPHFRITPPEVDLVVELVADELRAAAHTS